MKHKTRRLKCNITDLHLDNALAQDPHTIEFYLVESDLGDIARLHRAIYKVLSRDIELYLHEPMSVGPEKGRPELSSPTEFRLECIERTKKLVDISRQYGLNCIVHFSYTPKSPWDDMPIRYQMLEESVKELLKYDKSRCILWENSGGGAGKLEAPELQAIIEKYNLNLCLDTAHLIISTEADQKLFKDTCSKFSNNFRYFHICDAKDRATEGSVVGTQIIDWDFVARLVEGKPYITEINLAPNHMDLSKMIISGEYFEKKREEALKEFSETFRTHFSNSLTSSSAFA